MRGDDGAAGYVVEAKRTTLWNVTKGQQQAKLYAKFGVDWSAPDHLHTNGYEHMLWDDTFTPRDVAGF